ncbi:C39 family peptidase [Desertihabitans aurantiacus]|uniref:C39 family peptidase n=1 Tax=Desertihabitans aurantiacus TaxID=2282477 RepID=UPI0018E58B24|nr:C39 family peptidase [Desertihabitans aurantiacus]
MIPRRHLPRLALGATAGAAALTAFPTAAHAADRVTLDRWTSEADWKRGSGSGTGVRAGNVEFDRATSTSTYTDPHTGKKRTYDVATWTSQTKSPGATTELIASWNAHTQPGTFVEIRVKGTTTGGVATKWYVLGRWAEGEGSADIRRTSVGGQGDRHATVATDTLVMADRIALKSYQVQVRLHRPKGTTARCWVRGLTVATSAIPDRTKVGTSAPTGKAVRTLAVPTYSQQVHVGHFGQYGGGGEAWCSPTSVAMVLDYWKLGPSSSTTAWVGSGHADRQVDHAAKRCYDYAYQGTGNWPMCTAYAHNEGADAFVTRLRSLREAEAFIAAGIPLIASVSFKSSEMTGAGYSTAGHLLVIVGFTRSGDVVVNDPASHLKKSNTQVRTTYRRSQFENAWLPKSGGLVYIITKPGTKLPSSPGNW